MQVHPRVTGSAPPDPARDLWTQGSHAVLAKRHGAWNFRLPRSSYVFGLFKCFPQGAAAHCSLGPAYAGLLLS